MAKRSAGWAEFASSFASPTDRRQDLREVSEVVSVSRVEVPADSNAAKQELYDNLIGVSGFLLAGYAEGQTGGGKETRKVFQQLAGVLIQTILKTDPDKLRFTKDGLDIAG